MSETKSPKATSRKTAREDLSELSVSTWESLGKAIRNGRTHESIELMERCLNQDLYTNDSLVEFAASLLAIIAETCGEDAIERALRLRGQKKANQYMAGNPDAEEALRRGIEIQRGHHGNIVSVVEEPDRYVLTLDPCGTGGKLRRTFEVGVTKEAHPWSWGKSGVPYYCAHCCIQNEILPIEQRGYPNRISLCDEMPLGRCVHLYYKRPELIPEEYFTRLGKKKTIK